MANKAFTRSTHRSLSNFTDEGSGLYLFLVAKCGQIYKEVVQDLPAMRSCEAFTNSCTIESLDVAVEALGMCSLRFCRTNSRYYALCANWKVRIVRWFPVSVYFLCALR